MLEIYRTTEKQELVKTEEFEKGCWVNLTHPSEEEIMQVQQKLNILPNFLRDPLDEEEKPRVDVEENQALIIVDTPYIFEGEKGQVFETIPLGIIVTDDYIVTVSTAENIAIDSFRTNKVKGFFTYKKTRFTFQILFKIAKDFLKYLRYIDKKTDEAKKMLNQSMKNKELFELLELERSLVFFTTSLKENELVMNKLMTARHIKMYEDDQDLLEDVIIENKQALEMANIYSSILSGMMDAYASIISNNLNMVMKVLTSITIIMTISSVIAGFFGMNVGMPFNLGAHPYAFWIIITLCISVSIGAIYLLRKRQML